MTPLPPEPPLALDPPLASDPPFAPTPLPPEPTVPALAPEPPREPGGSPGREEQAAAATATANTRPRLTLAPTICTPGQRQRVELDKATLKHECEEPALHSAEIYGFVRRARRRFGSTSGRLHSYLRHPERANRRVRIVDGFERDSRLYQCEDPNPEPFHGRNAQP